MNTLVAVYGTLKQGGSNSGVMAADGGEYIGEGETVQKFTMYGGYGFPRVVFNGPPVSTIKIHLFRITDEPFYMDSLEGHPTFFRRRQIPVRVNDKTQHAWMYFHPEVDEHQAQHLEVVQDGYWEHL